MSFETGVFTKSIVDLRRSGPHLLITGGVHGDEFEGPRALWELTGRPELRELRGRLTLVPIVNEAAFRRGQRCADDGLDLARTCPGKAQGSVTEQTAHALSALLQTADSYIDLHTGGTALSVWPLAGYMLHPDVGVLEKQRAMARAFNLPVIWGTDPNHQGRSLSVARDANVPAIYAEFEGGGRVSSHGVTAYVEGCLNVMAHLGMIVRDAPPSNVQHVVEDARSGSGHMQRCYPAPAAGYFQCDVKLGDEMKPGAILGRLYGFDGRLIEEIASEQTGHVLVLRTFPVVKQGDSLAVILELPVERQPTSSSAQNPAA